MPFPRNVIQPKKVQGPLCKKDQEEENSLIDFTNLALVNIIRQIASLHSKVDIVFGHLLTESDDIHKRLKELKTKITDIDHQVKDMDSNTVVIGKALGKDRKAIYKGIAERSNYFQSEQRLDSGLFMEESLPKEIKVLHERADPMPRLQDLDKFRTDGKYGARFYSNPDLFYLAWQDTLQQMITEQHAKSLMKSKRTVRQTNLRRVRKAKTSRITEAQKLKMGKELASHSPSSEQEEEYFSDEEWSDSDEDDNVLLSPNRIALLRNGIHGAQNGALSVKSNHHRLSSFGEYRMEDLEHTKLTIDAHSPPVSMIERDFPLINYSGDTEEYSFHFSLDSMSISKWEDSEYKT